MKGTESLDALAHRQRDLPPASRLALEKGQTLAPGSVRPVDLDGSSPDRREYSPAPPRQAQEGSTSGERLNGGSAVVRADAPARTPSAEAHPVVGQAARGSTEGTGAATQASTPPGSPDAGQQAADSKAPGAGLAPDDAAGDEEREASGMPRLQRQPREAAAARTNEAVDQDLVKERETPAAAKQQGADADGGSVVEKDALALRKQEKGKASVEAGASEHKTVAHDSPAPPGRQLTTTAPAEGVVVQAAAPCRSSQPALRSPVKVVTRDPAAARAEMARIAGRLEGRLASPTGELPYWTIEVRAGALPELLESLRRLGAELPPASDRAGAKVECFRVLVQIEPPVVP
jgi:hypothetical protein